MPSDFQVETVRLPERTILVLRGEVDLVVSASVLDAGLDALAREPLAELLVDLCAVSFLDVSALGALVAVRNAATDRNVALRVSAASPVAARLLRVAGLDAAFQLDAAQVRDSSI